MADGWCYSRDAEVVGERCIERGAPGTLRFLGSAEPRRESQQFSYCTAGD